MRVGFLIWNEFQFYHVRSILAACPEAILLVDVRSGLKRRFPFHITNGLPNRVVRLHRSNLDPITDLVDILVVQSNTTARAQLPGIKIVSLQYSLSKEWHQYGAWMQEADLALCFGDYSRKRIKTAAPVIAVGNPRLDDYFTDRLDENILNRIRKGLDPDKPTVMLAPSWNNPAMISALKSGSRILRTKYNVLWSPHHVTRIFSNQILNLLSRAFATYDRYLYYLKVADVLVSDTSGSLFDALHVAKPVIIADFDRTATATPDSIEFLMRDRLGPVAISIEEISSHAQALIGGTLSFAQGNSLLRRECFCCNGCAGENTVRAIRSTFQ